MTLDNDVIPFNDNVPQNEDTSSDKNIQPPVNNTTPINQETENQTSDCQGGFKSCIDSISSLLSRIRDVLYDVSSSNVLKETEASLREILNHMVLACNHDSGLRISKSVKNANKKNLKIKRKAATLFDNLPRKHPKIKFY